MVRNVVVAIDGSGNSMKSLDYISAVYGGSHIELDLIYVLPALPPMFDDPEVRRQAKKQLEALEAKNREVGESILKDAKEHVEKKGIDPSLVRVHLEPAKVGPARDICNFAVKQHAFAIVAGARGRSRLEKFFTGSVSGNIVEHSTSCPVWIVNGNIKPEKVLIAVDDSENSMKAVEHAAFMLFDTNQEFSIFHTKRSLGRFIPKEVMDTAPDLEKLWQERAGQKIAPVLEKAVEKLKAAKIPESKISVNVIQGTRNPANDIVGYARKNNFGTIVMGRRGESDKKEYSLGTIAAKVIQDSANLSVWLC
jgi:nucleotide-binding universal stress UspA family protein